MGSQQATSVAKATIRRLGDAFPVYPLVFWKTFHASFVACDINKSSKRQHQIIHWEKEPDILTVKFKEL